MRSQCAIMQMHGMIGLGRMGGNMVATSYQGWPPGRRARSQSRRLRRRWRATASRPAVSLADLVQPAAVATGRLDHGARTRSSTPRSTRCSPLLIAGRHRHRRRQLALQPTTRAAPCAGAEGHRVRGCRHQRRRLGPRARLLPDDWRQAPTPSTRLDPIFRALAPGIDAAPRRAADGRAVTPAEHGYLHCGSARRRPLRQDGAQRHRVRDDGRLRRRASTCWSTRPTTSSICRRSPNSGGAAASSDRGCST